MTQFFNLCPASDLALSNFNGLILSSKGAIPISLLLAHEYYVT